MTSNEQGMRIETIRERVAGHIYEQRVIRAARNEAMACVRCVCSTEPNRWQECGEGFREANEHCPLRNLPSRDWTYLLGVE